MQIFHIAAECAPLIKVGGLGDVLYGLSKQCIKMGHQVEIILPFYKILNKNFLTDIQLISDSFHGARIWQAKLEKMTLTLVESELFDRDQVYGEKDDVYRFAFFSYLAHLYLLEKKEPFIVHLHDWHTALVALFGQHHYHTMHTIHNLAYMGECDPTPLIQLPLPLSLFDPIWEGNCYNLMKAAILFSDHITTVSESYTKEILYTPLGGKLQHCLLQNKEKISGIINGIDQDHYNPENDPSLPYHFSAKAIDNKRQLKEEVLSRFQLDNPFLACSITRLVYQKGPDLILDAVEKVVALGGSYILLGSVSDPETKARCLALKERLPNFHLHLTFDEELSHLIYAASDLFIMPSIYEPCGLTQLIALRYGTLPLVRKTGGLQDTIFDGQNGFTFQEPTKDEIGNCIARAYTLWKDDPTQWRLLQERAMEENHGWQQSAAKYLALYQSISSLPLKV